MIAFIFHSSHFIIYTSLYPEYSFHLMLPNLSLLAFKDNTPQLQRLHHTPNTPRNITPIVATLLTQHHIFYDSPIIIVSSHPNLASQHNKTLILRHAPIIATTVPGSTAFKKRWHLSSSDWWKPYAEITPDKADYKASISSSPVGSYGPSLTSMMTVPDSRARTVCHWPMGMFRATTGPPGESSMASVQRRSNSS